MKDKSADSIDTKDWRDAFKSNMTRVTFELKLTRAMLEFLCACSDGVRWDRRAFGGLLYPDNWLATEHALIRRGLLERLPRQVAGPGGDGEVLVFLPWKLTPAGEALIELLRVGGLFIEAQEAKAKFSGRKGHK